MTSLDEQAGRKRVRSIGRPRLPCVDHLTSCRRRPSQMKAGRSRLSNGVEHKSRDDGEVLPTRAAQRPEQVLLLLLVAFRNAPIPQHDANVTEPIARQPMAPSENAQTATKRESGNPNCRAAAGDNGQATLVECVVQLREPSTSANRGKRR